MYKNIFWALVVSGFLVLAGCQTQSPVMSIKEASTIKANFNITKFAHIPRSINTIKSELGNGGPIPNNCYAVRQKEKNVIMDRINHMHRVDRNKRYITSIFLNKYIERAMIFGQFQEIIPTIDKIIRLTPDRSAAKAPYYSQKARVLSQIGDIEGAIIAMKSFSLWARERANVLENIPWVKISAGQAFLNAGLASIAYAKGDFSEAEYYYRQAIKGAKYIEVWHGGPNIHELRANLIKTLILQGRLIEAEAEARSALKFIEVGPTALRTNKKPYQTENYSGYYAGPVTSLASVFLEQGRLEDAAYLARIAVNMHEVGCSEPESLGINRARVIYIRILAQQNHWALVLEQVNLARTALYYSFREIFNQQFGQSLDYAEAEIYSGNLENGKAILNRKIQQKIKQLGSKAWEDYEVAIIQGLLALIETKQGNEVKAIEMFSASLPVLADASPVRNSANLEGRKKRILSGYAKQLHQLASNKQLQVQWIDIPNELLKIANARKSNHVQNALISSRVRTTTDDTELSELIRQQQDLEEEAAAISEILVQGKFSKEYKIGNLNIEKIKQRLHEIRSASKAIKKELLSKFPKYAQLINPGSIKISELKKYLRRGQLLLIYQLEANYSYIWAINNNGDVNFQISYIGREKITTDILRLRQSVDPQPIETIDDIPEYDTALAHYLYNKLINPVHNSLNNIDELLIVADGSLGLMPFSMLVTEDRPLANTKDILFSKYKSVNWLANKFSIVQLPSINTLRDISYQKKRSDVDTRKPFIGFGDPIFSYAQLNERKAQVAQTRSAKSPLLRGLLPATKDDQPIRSTIDISILPRLPDTRDEILSIAKTLKADLNKDVHLGVDASEDVLLKTDLSNYKVLSFATHGLIPGDLNGLHQPALALTNSSIAEGEGDGVLTATEILGLNLSADIAVLSACNTAAGDGQGAEAISGLGRSFFYAGAKSILVSNWPVHSASTTELMTNLFTNLSNDTSLTRAEGLRRTKVKMINEMGFIHNGKLAFSYAHPIFWAPFTLVGDGG